MSKVMFGLAGIALAAAIAAPAQANLLARKDLSLETALTKREPRPPRKHGNIPL